MTIAEITGVQPEYITSEVYLFFKETHIQSGVINKKETIIDGLNHNCFSEIENTSFNQITILQKEFPFGAIYSLVFILDKNYQKIKKVKKCTFELNLHFRIEIKRPLR